ncbi:MAG: (Fe-S)-binding protein [Thermodesulfobacteriota bacterium]
MNSLTNLKEKAGRCVKCGNCLAQCPVYAETLEEPLSSRGKMALIESLPEQNLSLSDRFSKILSQCLLCGTCTENCPNGVSGDEIIREARSLLVKEKGLSLPKKAIFKYLLDSDRLMPWLIKGGTALQNILLKRIPKESGLHLRFPVPFLDQRRLIPPLAPDPFLNIYSGWIRAEKEVMRVGLFVGCVSNYLFPEISRSALELLLRQGISVFIPKDQYCCGLPALGSGDEETPLSLAKKNMGVFAEEDLQQIIVPCASCAAMLKLDYPALFAADDPAKQKIVAFSEKVRDLSSFLIQMIDGKPVDHNGKRNFLRVTYHDPCHLRRKLGVFREPRQLLKNLPGVQYLEMPEANRCCGQGGSFNIANYDLSLKIADRKIKAIAETDADVVTTACSGCLLQIMDGLHQAGLKKEVRHLAEMVNQAILL